ncbi:MAG TPA: hypothetical protein VHS09_03175, partial [Polyangiaceae bacterium]|nr:hypothetical protein [Polyangiaceae bacterium]
MRRHLLALLPVLLACACGAEPPPPPSPPPPPPPEAPATTAAAPLPQPVTVKRSLVSLTRPSGSSVATTAPDGTVTVAFEMKQNGRGPAANATIRLAPDGTIAAFEAHGHHEMQAPVDEVFSIEGGHARWK